VFVEDAIVVVKARVKERRQGPQGRLAPTPSESSDLIEEERPEISLQVIEAWPFASAPAAAARSARPVSAAAQATPAPTASLAPTDSGVGESARAEAGRSTPATLNVRLCGDAQDARRLGRLRDLVTSASGGPGKIVLHAG